MKTNCSSFIRMVGLLCLAITVSSPAQYALVRNPSFESNYDESWPHYGGIDEWTGGSGVNDRTLDAGGPFHDNGLTPDRNRVGFKQGSGDMSQTVFGLTPGQLYWIQFFYNCRQPGPLDIKVSFGGKQLDQILNVRPVDDPNPFRFRNVPFTAESDSGTLTFTVLPTGDQTALFDAVTLVARDTNDVVIINPSFEASGVLPSPGVATNLAEWSGPGTFGVDTAFGAYADNGNVPDQDLVAFIQGEGSITQTVSGLVVNQSYDVSFAYNAKFGETPHLLMKAGEAVIFDSDVAAVGFGNPFHTHTGSFTATAEEAVLSFAQTKVGFDTVLLDNVRLQGQVVVPPPPVTLRPQLALLAPGEKLVTTVTVPKTVLAQRSVTLQLASDPNVATITGADANGEITLSFDQTGAGTGPAQPVSGMKLWLKADAISGLADGAKVAQWVDSSGLSNDATNSATANQPTYVANGLNGKPTVRFSDHDSDFVAGAVEWLDSPAVVPTKQQPFTAFVVFRSDETDISGGQLEGRDNVLQPLDLPPGNANDLRGRTVLFVDTTGGLRKIQSVAAQASLVSSRDYAPGTWALSTLVQNTNTGTLTLALDGLPDIMVSMGTEPGVHGGWRLGASKPGHGGLKGELAEVILYDRALTGIEREQVEAYLISRWGLAVPSKALEITGVARGTTQVEVVGADGLEVENATAVSVTASLVRNPSFEFGSPPSGVGYGTIVAWTQTGLGGRNIAGMPFLGSLANGLIPDRDTVAFIQGAGTLSQAIYGLIPNRPYWLQFRYNLRDCCLGTGGEPPLMDLTVQFAGQTLAAIPAVQPLANLGLLHYYSTNLVFIPTSDSGLLEFATTPVSGDASLLLDAVTIVARDPDEIVVQNPSFEASGTPSGVGYVQPKQLSGWTTELGNWGVNIDGEGPFANNGVAQDQDLVLFLQSPGSYINQYVSGLTAGEKHTLVFAVNARQFGTNITRARVSFAGEILLEEDVTPIGGQSPYPTKYVVFSPLFTEGDLKFENASDAGTDTTLLLDNIRLVVGEVTAPVNLEIALLPGDIVRLAWPAEAVGYTLQHALTITGTWTEVGLQPVVEGDRWVVNTPMDVTARFYRLKK